MRSESRPSDRQWTALSKLASSTECAGACNMVWPTTAVLGPQVVPGLPGVASVFRLSVSACRCWTPGARLLPWVGPSAWAGSWPCLLGNSLILSFSLYFFFLLLSSLSGLIPLCPAQSGAWPEYRTMAARRKGRYTLWKTSLDSM